jgi:hypothetical protein
LGKLRRASGHYQGRLLAIDPHHMRSYTQRQTRRHRHKENETAVKTVQTFFCLDVETGQPLAATIGSAARTVTQGTPGLLELVAAILQPTPGQTLVLADTEHFTAEILRHVADETGFDLLIPMPESRRQRQICQSLPAQAFIPRWAGLAMATVPFQFARTDTPADLWEIVQRSGEKPAEYRFKSFVTTSPRDEVQALIVDYPQRWHVEEFFNANQALGWNRGGTLNLNIRYAQMTMALIAQAAIHGLRQRLGPPFSTWEASHLARSLFQGLDGDIRVRDDTIVVTFYNAPNTHQLRQHYENLPRKLIQENVDPRIPWLYDFKLDFRFK